MQEESSVVDIKDLLPTQSSSSRRRFRGYTLFHGAGQMLALWYSGTPFESVRIEKRATVHVAMVDRRHRSRSRGDRPNRYKFDAEVETFLHLSGPMAAQRFLHQSNSWCYPWNDELRQATVEVAPCAWKPAEVPELVDKAEGRVRCLLRQPGNWGIVTALASALGEQGHIHCSRALEVIEKATGEGERDFDCLWGVKW